VEQGIGQQHYSQESDKSAIELCQRLGVPYHTFDIKTAYGFSIDDLHEMNAAIKQGKLNPGQLQYRGICSFCGMIKRYTINKFAKDHGFTRVATGHNLTDESVSLIINFFNMNLNFLGRSHPLIDSNIDALVPRVKPLFYITEQEIVLYAYYAQINHVSAECIYANESPNLEIKRIFQDLDTERKGLFLSMMRQYQKKMLPLFKPEKGLVKPRALTFCASCGMAASSNKCSFCRNKSLLLARVNDLKKGGKNNLPEASNPSNSEHAHVDNDYTGPEEDEFD